MLHSPTKVCSTTEHQGVEILVLDFARCTDTKELLRRIDEAAAFIRTLPPQSVRCLTLTEGSKYDAAVIDRMKQFTKGNTPFIRRSAVYGLKDWQRFLYETVRFFTKRDIRAFDNLLQAKQWLVE